MLIFTPGWTFSRERLTSHNFLTVKCQYIRAIIKTAKLNWKNIIKIISKCYFLFFFFFSSFSFFGFLSLLYLLSSVYYSCFSISFSFLFSPFYGFLFSFFITTVYYPFSIFYLLHFHLFFAIFC